MKYFWSLGFLSLMLLLAPPRLWSEPEFHIRSSNRSIKTRQIFPLDIEAVWKSKEADYRFAPPFLQLENLSLEESGETNETFEKEGEEWRRKTFRFNLRALEKGKGRIRPFQVGYVDPQTAASGHFEAKEMEISIVPDWTRLFQWIAGGSLLGLGIFGVFGLVLMRKKKPAQEIKEPTLEERYLLQLDKAGEKISEGGRLFRAYLVERFCLPQDKVTNREILSLLDSRLSGEELKKLQKIFGKLDECQFGVAARSTAEHLLLHKEMTHFIEGKKII